MGKPDQDPALDGQNLAAWCDVLDEATYYEILGVLEIADAPAIRTAFHEFSLAFHPDAQPASDTEARALARRVFERGVEAYQTLSVPERRARYDLALARGELRLDAGPSGRPPDGETFARSLEDVCRSPGAKLYAKRAEDFITQGDLKAASHELFRALRAEEGENPELAERIAALTALTRLSGAPEAPNA
jgi:curved DNA-binding protein CbpA